MITHTVSVGRLGSEKIMASAYIRRVPSPTHALTDEHEGGGEYEDRRADAADLGAGAEGAGGGEAGSPAAKAEVRWKRRVTRKAGGGVRAKSRGAYTARVVEL